MKVVLLFLLLTAAALGLNFSPGFTAIFLFAFLSFAVLSEFLREKKSGAGKVLLLLGSCCIIPAVYIYAVGDDWLEYTLPAALIGAVLVYLIFFRRGKKGIVSQALSLLLLSGGLFSFFSSIASSALWPVAAGVLLVFTSEQLPKRRDLLFFSGVLLCDCFLIAPMLIAGGAA